MKSVNEGTNTLPVQVYRYSFEAIPEMSSTLDDMQIEDAFRQVNKIWAGAGIQWRLEGIEDRTVSRAELAAAPAERLEVRESLQAIAPGDTQSEVWKVVFIREFPVPAGGIYLPPEQTVYFAEWARGGPTSPVILAHELGHSLGLQHEQSSSNLMNQKAGGRDIPEQNATALRDDQINSARSQASRGPYDVAMQDGAAGRSRQPGSSQRDPAVRKARAADRLRSFDHNNDGVVLIDDVPTQGQKVFKRIDQDGDGRLTEQELSDFEN